MKKVMTKEDLSDLLRGFSSSIAFGAALETGLLQMLTEKPMDGKSVALVMNIPGKRGYYWLQMLEELGILELGPQGYVPSPLIRDSILDSNRIDRWKHVAADEREQVVGAHDLALYISEPGSIWEAQGLIAPKGYVEKMSDNSERASVFTRLLYDLNQGLGSAIAELLNMTGVERIMDVGGGSGVISIALVKKHPNITSTIVDIKNVCDTGHEIVEENQLSDRITFYPADFVTDELPQGFDMVLHCDIGVFGEKLFRKLWMSLNPGGLVVVVFQFPPAETSAPTPYLRWAFLDSLIDPDFGFPTVVQVQGQLVKAGYQLLPEVHTLTDGQIIIQARKIGG